MKLDPLHYEFETSGITFHADIDWEHRYLFPRVIRDKQQSQPFDDEGVGVRNVNGHYYIHPLNLAAFGLTRLGMYTMNEDPEYLKLVFRQAERLISRAIERETALFFPYSFPWGQGISPLQPPWFSGMAQGYALSLFSRLYEVTGIERYLDIAHQVFESYLMPRDQFLPWTTDLIDGKYLWFDEYASPNKESGGVINGHVYSVVCLHDYWKVTGDERAQLLADGGLTTLLGLMDRWRQPGGISYYSTNDSKATATYHRVHSNQIRQIFTVTADPLWVKLQDLFMEDYPTQSGSSEPSAPHLVVKPGEYRVGVRGDLRVTDHVDVVIEEERHMRINTRARRYGERHISTRVLEEDFEYMWFEEIPGQVYVSGIAEPVRWAYPVTHTVTAPVSEIVKFDDAGEIVSTRPYAVNVGSTVEVVGRGLIKAEVWMQLAGPELEGYWIPKSSLEIIL